MSTHSTEIAQWFDQLKGLDIHEVAEKLGLKRPKSNGNYTSPHHKDSSPSLAVLSRTNSWRDYSGDDKARGSTLDLVMYCRNDVSGPMEAARLLGQWFGYPMPRRISDAPPARKSTAEYIADRCLAKPGAVMEYLTRRGISESVVEAAIRARSVGFNDWCSNKVAEGEVGYGGPAAAFIVRSLPPSRVVAVDLRYLDPDRNGGVKTQCQGEKDGYGWTSDLRRLKAARTVVIVESPINALSVECCGLPGVAAYAIRGTTNVDLIDWTWLRGRRVLIALDHADRVNAATGLRPGLAAAWRLYECLTALNIGALLVDMGEWEEGQDINDVLAADGDFELGLRLKKTEPWLIPGLPGNSAGNRANGRPRVYLPSHDFARYWRFRVREDFTSYVDKVEKDDDSGEERVIESKDLCGFRVASLSRVTVQSATATMTGDEDAMPNVYFAASVQMPRHGALLIRRVFEDEQLHNIDQWRRFGPIWTPAQFARMLSILERTAHLGERRAVNFVGLAWKEGKLVVNEGPDCYFTDPDKQCPYHNLTFPAGPRSDAQAVIEAYQGTFRRNAAMIALTWALGGHLKALLGFWPHLVMQADKGAGKSTLIKRIERTIAFTMFSGQSLQTEFRLVTSVSHTSHPVGWEELSARRQDIIDKAVGLLQENYQYTVSRRGSEMTEYLLSAPVLLAGEDVPVRSLIGKICRTDLSGKKGLPIDDSVPRFPLRQWLQWLSELDRRRVTSLFDSLRERCRGLSRAGQDDDGAMRMAGNYAALLTGWHLLTEFAGLDVSHGGFEADLVTEMNSHIAETGADRSPWVWIMETALSEIAAGRFDHPYQWGSHQGEQALFIRAGHIMDHLSGTSSLREKWNGLPVKSDRVFKKQLMAAGVVLADNAERTVHTKRVGHMLALSLSRLEQYGLYATPSVLTG